MGGARKEGGRSTRMKVGSEEIQRREREQERVVRRKSEVEKRKDEQGKQVRQGQTERGRRRRKAFTPLWIRFLPSFMGHCLAFYPTITHMHTQEKHTHNTVLMFTNKSTV